VEFNTLTLTLQNFIAAFSGGYARLAGPINSLLAIFVTIEVVLLGLWSALGGGANVAGVFKKILHIGLWVWIIKNFPDLAHAFVESLIRAGLMAGGGGVGGDVSVIMDPSRIAGYGLDATELLAKKLEDLGTFDLNDELVFGFGYLAIMACFLIMAVNIFIAVLEYYMFVACVGVLLPFGLIAPTKFLAEKAIGAVVAAGIKLMVLAFVTAAIEPVMAGLRFKGPDIPMNELWAMALTVGGMTLLCWKAPHLASSVLAGAPSFGGSSVAQDVLAGAGVAASLATAGSAKAAADGIKATQAAAGASASGGTAGGTSGVSVGLSAARATGAVSGGSGGPPAPGADPSRAAAAPGQGPPAGADSTLVRSSGGPPPPAPPPTLVTS
jgi:type IV secretion system protein TrbL